jgi:hypothetical protein
MSRSRSYLRIVLTLTILVLGALAAWGATASFTPSPQGGDIFAVINANRSARSTTISVTWGSFRTTVGRGNQYGNCAGPMSGWVLLVRNTKPGSNLFTLTTSGTIVRPPYQGPPPPEVSHSCYKLERIRAR